MTKCLKYNTRTESTERRDGWFLTLSLTLITLWNGLCIYVSFFAIAFSHGVEDVDGVNGGRFVSYLMGFTISLYFINNSLCLTFSTLNALYTPSSPAHTLFSLLKNIFLQKALARGSWKSVEERKLRMILLLLLLWLHHLLWNVWQYRHRPWSSRTRQWQRLLFQQAS